MSSQSLIYGKFYLVTDIYKLSFFYKNTEKQRFFNVKGTMDVISSDLLIEE